MIYGYARVSTVGQARDGNSLEAQQQKLTEAGAAKIYHDAYTGKKRHRPQFDKLMKKLKSGDTLIVTKLDRIARSTVDGSNLIEELLGKGVIVNVLNLGVMNDTPNGKLIRHIFFAFAEWERDMIIERTSEGKAVSKQRENYKEGRPRKEITDFQKFLQKQKDGLMTVNDCCRELGITRRTWYNRVAEISI